MELTFAHTSMQFGDSLAQVEDDFHAIFVRAGKLEHAGVGGTEAGASKKHHVREVLFDVAPMYGFRAHVKGDTWVAVPNRQIVPGSWETGAELGITDAPGVDRYLTWARWQHPKIGPLSFGEVHFKTHGRPVKNPAYRKFLKDNRHYADVCRRWGIKHGAGRGKAFLAGDFNIPDDAHDVLLGAPFTTAADAVGKHPNTGHGPIDGIASYDQDHRVHALRWKVFTDSVFRLNTDHFYCEATFGVRG